MLHSILSFFFFNDTATTEIYTLSLHDALPISEVKRLRAGLWQISLPFQGEEEIIGSYLLAGNDELLLIDPDRKSTRLNSSHANISYAVFCLKKKNNTRSCQEHPHKKGRL